MNVIKIFLNVFLVGAIVGCAPYSSPPRYSWPSYLNGASFTDMTEISRVAKRPVYLGAGGKLVGGTVNTPDALEYGDKIANDWEFRCYLVSIHALRVEGDSINPVR